MRFKKAHLLVAGLLITSTSFLSFKPDDKYFEIAKNLDIFATLFKEVNKYYVEEISPTDLVNIGINSMLGTLDPYTNYIPEEQLDDYRTMTTGEYGGIGAIISKRDDRVLVVMPNEGYAAYRAGLKIGDEILEIDGQDVRGKSISEISRMLKGEENTTINLLVKRFSEASPVRMQINRERIHLNNVPYYGMVEGNIGLIQLTDFTQNASREVKNALIELKKKGAEKIILDLRGNPGGLLSEAINVANVFLPRGSKVVETKGKIEDWNKSHKALNTPLDVNIPLAVLIDRGSASAAEIVSGVLQDYDRGVLVGERSFGKGLVQQTLPLSYNSKLKITVAKYYIPSGRCIQEIDYSHRNEYGMASRVPDSLRVPYKTRGGRKVFDGGGIDPDLRPEQKRLSPITRSLISKGLVFDYATAYRHNRPSIAAPKSFTFTEADYQAFKNWLKDKDYDYETRVEKLLEDLVASSKKERYYQDIEKQINDLRNRISHNKERDLEKFKEEIIEELEAEIATRYYLHKGQIEASFDDDPDINTALEVLKDEPRYDEILTAAYN